MSSPDSAKEQEIPATPRSVALSLVVALCTLIAANMIAGAMETNLGSWLIRTKWDLLQSWSGGPVDWVFLGDSSCNQAISPARLTERTGQSSVNLCVIGDALAVNDAWMVKAWLAQHPAPRRGFVIVHVDDMWHRDATILRTQLLPDIPVPARSAEPAVVPSQREALMHRVRWLLPLWYKAASIRGAVQAGFPRFAIDAYGFMQVSTGHPDRVQADIEAQVTYRKAVLDSPKDVGQPPRFSAANDEALSVIAGLSQSGGADVFLLPGPVAAGLQADPSFAPYHASIRAQLEAAATNAHVHVAYGEVKSFPNDQMENADHVVGNAALAYTDWVGTQLASPRE